MHIKSNLVYLKQINNLTVRQLAKATGLTNARYGNIINGKINEKNLTIETVTKLANYFKVSLDDFVFKDLAKENKNCGKLPQCKIIALTI